MKHLLAILICTSVLFSKTPSQLILVEGDSLNYIVKAKGNRQIISNLTTENMTKQLTEIDYNVDLQLVLDSLIDNKYVIHQKTKDIQMIMNTEGVKNSVIDYDAQLKSAYKTDELKHRMIIDKKAKPVNFAAYQMEQQLSDLFKNMNASNMSFFLPLPIESSESWMIKDQIIIDMNGMFTVAFKYDLVFTYEEEIDTLGLNFYKYFFKAENVESKVISSKLNSQGVRINYELDYAIGGFMLTDPRTGVNVYSSIESDAYSITEIIADNLQIPGVEARTLSMEIIFNTKAETFRVQ